MSGEASPIQDIVPHLLRRDPVGKQAENYHLHGSSDTIRMRAMTPAPSATVQSDPNVTVTETAVSHQSAASEHGESSVSSVNGNGATAMRRKAHVMYGALLYSMLLSGWNDGTTGPLLPRIQAVYHVCAPCTMGRRRSELIGNFSRSALPSFPLSSC